MASGLGGPVAVFNNGQVVFVRSCRSGVWVGLDGSATGEVAAAEQDGLIAGLTLAQGEGAGVALAWSRFSLIGGVHSLAQVLVADILGTTLAPIGGDLAFESGLNASQGGISLGFHSEASPVLGTLLGSSQLSGLIGARVFRFVP